MNREEVRTNTAYQEVVGIESSSRVLLVGASQIVVLIGRFRPDLDFDLNLDSDRRIIARVQAVSMAGGTILNHTEK
jgi:hypothetical protein